MNKKKLLLIIFIVILGISLFLITAPDNKDTNDNNTNNTSIINNTNNTSIINNTNENANNIEFNNSDDYDGININKDNTQINSDIIINEHINQLNNLNSYNMLIGGGSGTSYKINKDKNNSIVNIKSKRLTDKKIYDDGKYIYSRSGSPTSSINYSTSKSPLNITTYYPSDNVKSILNNTKIESISESDKSVELKFEINNAENLYNIHNVDNIYRYDLKIVIQQNGLIESFSLNMIGGIRDSENEYSYNYNIRNINQTNVKSPDWLNAAINENPLVDVTYNSGNKLIQIKNDGGRDINKNADVDIYIGPDNVVSGSIPQNISQGEEIYIKSISNNNIEFTTNKEQGSINENDYEDIQITDGNVIYSE